MTVGLDVPTLSKRVDKIEGDTDLRSVDFADAILGLLFITLADTRFERVKAGLEVGGARQRRSGPGPVDFHANGAYYFPPGTRLADLLAAPSGGDLGGLLSSAMRKLGTENPGLSSVVTIDFRRVPDSALQELLKVCSTVRAGGEVVAEEVFSGFLTRYALDEDSSSASVGHTPSSIATLIAAVLDLRRGRVLDPYCRGADLLIAIANSARARHGSSEHLSLSGQTATRSLANRATMNLAAHRIEAEIKTGRPLLDDPFHSVGKFDSAVVNPPFNAAGPDPHAVDGDARFVLGLPLTRSGGMKKANYLWVESVYAALKPGGRAAILLPNSVADATASELEIRRALIKDGAVEAIYSIGPNFYETGSNPVMLWFLRRPKGRMDGGSTVLFVDAREIKTEISRSLNVWSSAQVDFLAGISGLHRGEKTRVAGRSKELLAEQFPADTYADVVGLCAAATESEVEAKRWSLSPGRYVGTPAPKSSGTDVHNRLISLREEYGHLAEASLVLEQRVEKVIDAILGIDFG